MPSIKKNFFYSSILTTANYIFPLLTFPYVSRVLGVTNVGICNFIDSVISYFILFSMMGIGIVGIREVAKYKNDRQKLNETFSGLFCLNTITTSFALLILILLTLFVDKLRIHWEMMIIGGLKLVMHYMLIEWLYKGLEEFRFITIRTLIVKTLYVVSVFIFVHQPSDYQIYYLLTVLMVVCNALINITYSHHYVSLTFSVYNIKKFLKPFFVLGVYTFLTSMYISFNVVYLGFVAGETQVGYYTTASKLYKLLIALFSAFTGVMLPRMSSLLSEGRIIEFKHLLSRSTKILFMFSVPLVVLIIIYADTVIYLIAGNGYEGAVMPMRIMMPLMIIIGYEQIIIVQGLMPLRKDKAILRNSLIGAAVGVVLNILLVSTFSSIGSAVVWLFSEISVLISAQWYISKYANISFPKWNLIKEILLYIPLVFIVLYINMHILNGAISLVFSTFVTFLYFVITHYSDLRGFVKSNKI